MKQQDLFAAPPPPKAAAERPASPGPPAPERVAAPPAAPAGARPVAPAVLSVSELTRALKGVLEPAFRSVVVRGEVTGFRGPAVRGHLYFSIKDDETALDVKMWAGQARLLRFALKDGLGVVVEGRVEIYEKNNRYSLIASRIEPDGVGARALAFEQLKVRLATEGLIGPSRRKPRLALPLLPRRIGVVTSVTGAALRDFLKVLYRRHPRLSVLVADARVQGDGADREVCRAIERLGRTDVDVIVVTRGGGSVDDLWTFNEESVARAIFAAKVPVVSAVGHEIDTTLADLVADVRAPTPSAGAELVAPVLADLELRLGVYRGRLGNLATARVQSERVALRALAAGLEDPRRALSSERERLSEAARRAFAVLRRRTQAERRRLAGLVERLQRTRPQALVSARRGRLAELRQRLAVAGPRLTRAEAARLAGLAVRLERSSPAPHLREARLGVAHRASALRQLVSQRLLSERQRLGALAARLDALSPLRVLARGYAIVRREADGHAVRRADDVRAGQTVRLQLHEGELTATVTGSRPAAK